MLCAKFNQNIKFEFIELEAGWECFVEKGTSLPKQTLDELKQCNCAVFGAVSSPSGKVEGYSSPIVGLRRELGLYANIRPAKSLNINVSYMHKDVNMYIVRENTECCYTGQERLMTTDIDSIAVCNRIISKNATQNIARAAVSVLQTNFTSNNRITIAHKANVMPITDGLFLKICRSTLEEACVCYNDCLVDSLAMKVEQNPGNFNVIVAPNFHGDILSDVASAVTGGLGLSAGLNLGSNFMIAEPVHGSAPDIAGKGIANPIATFRSVGLMLDQMMHTCTYSKQIDTAIEKTFIKLSFNYTPDMNGEGTTISCANTILDAI